MNYFETPNWGEANETDKWAEGLFASSNVIHAKVFKKRKRNKYPTGFKKTDSLNAAKRTKDDTTLLLNDVKPGTSKEPTAATSKFHFSKGKKKRKNAKPPSATKDSMCAASTNVEETIEISSERIVSRPVSPEKFNPKKKKKKANHNKDLNDLKTQQSAIDVRQNSTLVSEEVDQISSVSFAEKKLCKEIVNTNKSKPKNKKRKKAPKGTSEVTQKTETSDDFSSGLISESGEVLGKQRKHLEDDKISKNKGKKRKKTDNEGTDQIDGIYNEYDLQAFPFKANRKSLDLKSEEEISLEQCVRKTDESCDQNGSLGVRKKKLNLRKKMEEKLRGARFRFLNEQLYTSESKDTNKFFLLEPGEFEAYHEGYKQQLMQWPVKPIDLIIRSLKKKPSAYVIADFGSGDAQIAQSLPNEVHSFDHVALNNHVTVCDMAHTPLTKGSVDVVVFCLSLMGSNLSDYILEANRVLKIGGLLKIAEVESRFDNVDKFVKIISRFGFLCIHQDSSHDYFYIFDFQKENNPKKGKVLPAIELRACSYKKR